MRKLTRQQTNATVKWAHKMARERKAKASSPCPHCGRTNFDDNSFFSGAQSAFFGTGTQGRIPAVWLYQIQLGKPVLNSSTKDEEPEEETAVA